jgi:Mg-chelatase subunit ChlD
MSASVQCRLVGLLFLSLLLPKYLWAQRGYSDASVSMNRANGIVEPSQVIIEEYLNYHTHQIPLPTSPATARLSLAWGNTELSASDSLAVLQIGIATSRLPTLTQRPPINVSLVVDCSGSMQQEGRLEKVKTALRQFGRALGPQDHVALVTYSSEAQVVLPAQLANRETFEQAVSGLAPDGSTNLCSGMLLGYQQVMRFHKAGDGSRVILLTDGLVNTGETDLEKIVAASATYTQQGVEISTIGVGSDVNFALLQQLARSSRGQNHFIGANAEDLRKTFDQELESLLGFVGKSPVLSLSYPPGLELTGLLGYSPQLSPGHLELPLNTLPQGLTQVVLVKFRVRGAANATLPVQAELRYTNQQSQPVRLQAQAELQVQQQALASDKALSNQEVRKNYLIGYLATQLKELARLTEAQQLPQAVRVGQAALRVSDRLYPNGLDKDVQRVRDIVASNVGLAQQAAARGPARN